MNGLRLRQSSGIRSLLAETHLLPSQLIMPIFVHEGLSEPKEIPSMPGIFQLPISHCVQEVETLIKLGINTAILFGIPQHKDERGSAASSPQGGVQQAIRKIKAAFPQFVLIADCCLCEYTRHGHCTVFNDAGHIDLRKTLAHLGEIAVSYAQAGADIIAPSGMLDGMVSAIRNSLDVHQFSHTLIMSYAVKYASAFYGPFRDAGGSELGKCDTLYPDRKHHQMNPSQSREALQEAEIDIREGADILMVKPALPYLDILSSLSHTTNHPLAAYQVSGEYAMIKAAAQKGWLNEADAIHESLIAIRRAGATMIITYFAKEWASGQSFTSIA
jgi:porphobilinogen synthase